MIHQTLLRRAVAGRDPVLVEFVETLVPAILTRFTTIPALGGSPDRRTLEDPCLPLDIPRYPPEALERFSEKHDQSMTTHILNGIFAGMRIVEKLPPHKALDDLEKRLWLLGYVVHDYTKVYGIKVAAGDLPLIRQAILCLGEALNFGAFLSHWKDHLDDIAFLAQNTQTVEGANLNTREFTKLKTPPRRLEVMRLLSSIADILVHITSPSDVAERGADDRDRASNLRDKLQILFGAGSAPRLAYHRLTEVRGLVSNLINNAVMDALKAQDYEPFLFFPNGVVYVVVPNKKADISNHSLPEIAWKQVSSILMRGGSFPASERSLDADSDEDTVEEKEEDAISGGLGIKPRRGLKVAPILYELLTLEQLLREGKNAAMGIRGSAAFDRFVSQKNPEQTETIRALRGKEHEVELDALRKECESSFKVVLDNRTDQIAEFLAFIWRRILGEMFPDLEKTLASRYVRGGSSREEKLPKGFYAAKEILNWLDISNVVSPHDSAFQKGMRIPTGWYCTAGAYLNNHPEIDPDGIEALFDELIERLTAFVAENNLQPRQVERYEEAFIRYVGNILQVDGQTVAPAATLKTQFQMEYTNYIELKEKNRLVCSMCSSPFGAGEQLEQVVLFKGQQYSNKGQLGVSQVKRGICPICSIEMMLRQIQQEMPAKTAEDDKYIYLYLYPTYFFTPETAQVLRFFLNNLIDLDLSPFSETSLIRHLRKQGYQPVNILQYDRFLVEAGDEPLSLRRLTQAQYYSEKDFAGLFMLSLKPIKPKGRNLTDTDAWTLPTLYGLALPLLLNLKIVVTPSFMPVFGTGADFRETVVLDAPYGFIRHVLGRDRFRVDEVGDYLIRLLRLYDLHLDVFAEPTDFHWAQINAVAKDVATDPLYVFAYHDRKARGDKQKSKRKKGGKAQTNTGVPEWDINRYLEIYQALGGEPNMGLVGKLVDAYAEFYRARGYDLSAYEAVRPLNEAIEATVKSDAATQRDDLALLIVGPLADVMERVWDGHIEATDPIIFAKDSPLKMDERRALSRQKQETFVELFLAELFEGYCKGQRAVLQERANRIRSAAKFYYLKRYYYNRNK